MARSIAFDYDTKRGAILRAAARLFADEGYGRASMAEVARRCRISKANIYHYYPSKEALLFDMLETHLRDLRDRVLGLTFDSNDPKDQLRIIITEILLAYQGADAEHDPIRLDVLDVIKHQAADGDVPQVGQSGRLLDVVKLCVLWMKRKRNENLKATRFGLQVAQSH